MEKQWKQKTARAVLIIAGILTIGFFITGCKDDPTGDPCTCPNGTEDDAPCPCGGDDCVCTVKPVLYQTWTEIAGSLNIQFWKEVGVTDTQMNAIINAIKNDIYGTLPDLKKINLANNVTEIRVKPDGAAISHTGTILYIKYDTAETDIRMYLATNSIAQTQQKDAIRLAKEFDTARETVRISMGNIGSKIII
jgi:hypothetical protein